VPEGRILLVEDDGAIGESLAGVLRGNGFDTEWVTSGGAALEAGSPPDLVLLDLGLPDLDGLEVCRGLRARWPSVFIVMLTARSEEVDVVLGLEAGADDYVVKPFRLAELLARVRAHLRRRPAGYPAERIVVGNLVVDLGSRRVWLDDGEIVLRSKEFDLLSVLAAEPGRVISRDRIMREVWDQNWYGSTKTLDMHISALRRKLGCDVSEDGLITTVRGQGYRFNAA